MEAQKIHRSARLNYAPRAAGFLATFIAIVLLAGERHLGTGPLLLAVACFLVYPHLAFFHARIARHSQRAERINLLIDNVLLGCWVAATGFNLWFGFALFLATVLNSTVIGGPRRMMQSATAFALAAGIWSVLTRPDFEPHSSLAFSLYMAFVAAVYVLAIGVIFHRQHRELAQAHRTIGRNNRVFRSLLELEMLSSIANSLAELVDQTLDHFFRTHSGRPFGLALFNRERPSQLTHSAFRGIDPLLQDSILSELATLPDQQRRNLHALDADSPHPLVAISMGHHLNQAYGFVITSRDLAEALDDTLELFVDRLASGLQNKLLDEQLRKAAETDGLTGLFNRAYLERQLAAAAARKRQHPGIDFSVIMLDVIGLKRTNDSLGHEAGDQLIRTIADRLASKARTADVVARFGGDEFVVLCPGCREEEAAYVAQRLADACRCGPVPTGRVDDRQTEVTVEISVGAAGSDCHEPDQVLSEADARMYEDKQSFYQRHSGGR